MDFLGTLFFAILNAIATIYLAPLDMLINPYDNVELVMGLFFLLLIYIPTGLALLWAVVKFCEWVRWRVKRQQCQHKECGQQWTTGVRHGNRIGCRNEQPCCSDCDDRHDDEDAQRAADAEKRIKCPPWPRRHGQGT